MPFGVTLLTQQPRGRDPTQYLKEITSQARLAEELGFDSLWLTEHHFLEDEIYFDNVQLLSYLACETDDIGLGSSVWLLPLHNPVKMAERVANLDVMSEGRFTLGVGAGYRQKEFEIFGVDRSARATRMKEGLELIKKLWSEDHVHFDGSEYSYEDASINPKPIQEPRPEIWIGGNSKVALRHTAESGDAWIPSPALTDEKLEKLYGYYDGYCEEIGSTPTSRPLMREVYVADTEAEAMDTASGPLQGKYETYSSWDNENATGESQFSEFSRGRFIIGDPDHAIEQIDKYVQAFGVDHLIARMQWPTMSNQDMKRSLETFASEVAPSF